MGGDDRTSRRLDQVDRTSQVTIRRAIRARDVSRPDAQDVTAALDAFEAGRRGEADDDAPAQGSARGRSSGGSSPVRS